jgi:hypothetical protein
MLEWAWRLGAALGPFRGHDPALGLHDFAFSGWTLRVPQLLSQIYQMFFTQSICVANDCDYYEDNPLSKFDLTRRLVSTVFTEWTHPVPEDPLHATAGAASAFMRPSHRISKVSSR